LRTFEAWSVPVAVGHPVPDADPSDSASGVAVHRLSLSPPDVARLLEGLREAREGVLSMPARAIAAALGSVGERFLDPGDELRREALDLLPATAGISPEMARRTLDGMAGDWSARRLRALLEIELKGGDALDGFVFAGRGRRARALGAPVSVHVCAGTVPGVSVTSMVRALLVKSAVLLKPGRGDLALPVLFRRGLEQWVPALAAAAAVVYWRGGEGEPVEGAALRGADLVVVYGGDDSVRAVRAHVAGTTAVVAHPHRVSFAVVGEGALGAGRLEPVSGAAAEAVALFDQRGCVSPHLFYVLGDGAAAGRFAEALAAKLRILERELPSEPLDPASAAALQALRGTAELMAASGSGRMWAGSGASWTVVLDPETGFEPSCLGRTVRVKAAASVTALLEAVRPFHRHLQTVGVAGLDEATLSELAEGLARLAPIRLAPLESAPWPPPWWHHDGMQPLGSLLRWSDLEEGID
jgi:hypothetical protein